MLTNVMEDRLHAPRVLRFATILLVVAGVASADAQSRGDTDFSARVIDLSGVTSQITVTMGRSVTVETSIETVRADVIARHVADVQLLSPKRMLITGQQYGQTSIVLLGADDRQHVFDVAVELDLKRLNKALGPIDPLGKPAAISVRGHIILTGTVTSAARAKRMANLASLFLPLGNDGEPATSVQNNLEVAGEQQVLIRCVVAEMSRSALRELGVNGFLMGENFRDGFLVNQIDSINPINIGAAADAVVTANVPFLTGSDGIPLDPAATISLGFPRAQTQLFMKALAENSLLAILAEPNLVATSGETATFLAGGEFPVPVPQGNDRVTIEFKAFGVRLNFTPIVNRDQSIRLRIAPEVSELDEATAVTVDNVTVRGVKTRSAETTVTLGSGQTIAIGGMLNETTRGFAKSVPGIGDLPILGALFRSVNYQRSLTELVILVTPEIVAPLEAHQAVNLAVDRRTDPNDFELYALGLLDGLTTEDSADLEEDAGGSADSVVLRSQPREASIHGPWGLATMPEMQ